MTATLSILLLLLSSYETTDFRIKLDPASQTLVSLQPKNANGFDFAPADRFDKRAGNGFHHLGDLILSVRTGAESWKDYDTATDRKPVQPLPVSGQTLAAADVSPPDIPLQITRSWINENGRTQKSFLLLARGRAVFSIRLITQLDNVDQLEEDGRRIDWSWLQLTAYWSLYRLARNHAGLVTNYSWDWYLDQAYETTKFMFGRQSNGRRRVGYVELGLMEGDIVLEVLKDLKREGSG